MGNRGGMAPIASALAAAGGVAVAIGSLLPWVWSGRVGRNLYQLAGLADRLGFLGTVPSAVLAIVPILCALPVVLLLLSLVRFGALAAIVIGFAAMATGVGVIVVGSGRSAAGIAVAVAGPITAAAGGLILIVAGIAAIGSRQRARQLSADRS